MRSVELSLSVFFVASIAALGYSAWHQSRNPEPEICHACRRPVHVHSRTLADVNGHRTAFCCPACALSEHTQTGASVRVRELTDYLTGTPLSPKTALLVVGSDVNPCIHSRPVIDQDKRTAPLVEDRCAPSMLAFGNRQDAQTFQRAHGGRIVPFEERAAAYAQ
jgi:hypothetical protein